MDCSELLSILRALAPEELAMPGDPVGLLIEPERSEVNSIVVCLDATRYVANAAIVGGASMIVSHHPLIYNPLKRLSRSEPISAVSMSLVQAGIGLYAMHTNWDAATGGINDTLAEVIGLKNVIRLSGSPLASLGRIGNVDLALSPAAFIDSVAAALRCSGTSALRYLLPGSAHEPVERVAICGGAGAELIEQAINQGADAFVTADVRHHEFLDASARGLLMVDAGHEATEAPGMLHLARILEERGLAVNISFCPNSASSPISAWQSRHYGSL